MWHSHRGPSFASLEAKATSSFAQMAAREGTRDALLFAAPPALLLLLLLLFAAPPPGAIQLRSAATVRFGTVDVKCKQTHPNLKVWPKTWKEASTLGVLSQRMQRAPQEESQEKVLSRDNKQQRHNLVASLRR